MSERKWLECEVKQGMFGGEVTVDVTSAEPPVSLFASSDAVENQAGRSWLSVTLLERNDQFGLVELPYAAISGSSVVKVPLNILREP